MRAENRRPNVHPPLALTEPAAARFTPRLPGRERGGHLRLVAFEPSRAVRHDRGTAVRLLLGFAAIVGFVVVGLWVEFGALERAAYLVSSLGFFSLYGAATWVNDPEARSRSAGRGR